MNILIVEDDILLRAVWEHALANAAHKVSAVESCVEAMRLLLTQKFDLIVLDVFVQDGNSLSLVDYISYAHPGSPIMVTTGTGFFPNGEITALISKVDWFLRKPLPVADFMAIVDHAHERAQRRALPRQEPEQDHMPISAAREARLL